MTKQRVKYCYSLAEYQRNQFGHPLVQIGKVTEYEEEDKRRFPSTLAVLEWQTDPDNRTPYAGSMECALDKVVEAGRLVARVISKISDDYGRYTRFNSEVDKRAEFIGGLEQCRVRCIEHVRGVDATVIGWRWQDCEVNGK